MRMFTAAVIGILVVVGAIALRPRIARADLLKVGQLAPPFSTQMVTGDQQTPISLDAECAVAIANQMPSCFVPGEGVSHDPRSTGPSDWQSQQS